MSMDIRICVMAGGVGERFWPYSRASHPKQLRAIVGDLPLVTATVQRNNAVVPPKAQYIVTTRTQADAIHAAAPELPRENIIAEPCGRNTAPCIALMCALIAAENPEAILAVVPADHYIPDSAAYAATIRMAADVAHETHALVTLGIVPRGPETGYGYIQAGAVRGEMQGNAFYAVERFIEKPSQSAAEELIAGGDVYWNAGMFVFRVTDMCAAFATHTPALAAGMDKITAAQKAGNASAVIDEVYRDAESISIDYAIMEKAAQVCVVPAPFAWDDVGSWPAAATHWPTDEAENARKGAAVLEECRGCVVANEGEGIVAAVGMEDVIIVRTADAVLVCPRDRAQDVKKIVGALRADASLTHFVE